MQCTTQTSQLSLDPCGSEKDDFGCTLTCTQKSYISTLPIHVFSVHVQRAPPLHVARSLKPIAHAYIVWPVSRPQIDCFRFERRLDRKELAASCDCTCKSPNTAAHLLSKCDV